MLRDITAKEFQEFLISIILGTNLPITDAAMLGSLRTEKILRNNKKILFPEFNLSKKLHWPAGSNCLSRWDRRTTEGK